MSADPTAEGALDETRVKRTVMIPSLAFVCSVDNKTPIYFSTLSFANLEIFKSMRFFYLY